MVLLGGIGPAAVVIDAGVVGLELDGLIVVVDGEVELAGLRIGVAAIAVGGGIGSVQPDRLVEFGDRLGVVALVLIGDAAIVIGDGEIVLGVHAAADDLATAVEADLGVTGDAVVPVLLGFGQSGLRQDEGSCETEGGGTQLTLRRA